MQYEQGSPDAFAAAMLERAQDPSKSAKPKGVPVELFAAAIVAVVLAVLAYALVS